MLDYARKPRMRRGGFLLFPYSDSCQEPNAASAQPALHEEFFGRVSGLEFQHACRNPGAPGKSVTIGKVTMKVRAFRR
jgi:hypothetical protein